MDIYIPNNSIANNYQTLEPNYSPNYNNTIMDSFPNNYYEKSILNDTYHANVFSMSNTYNNLGALKLRNNNFNNKNNNGQAQSNDINKLNFKFIESTTEDVEHPLMELKKGLKGRGWQSSRFSQFPQDIYIQFPQPVLIKRIDIITHEKNIPSQIKFYSYCPKDNEEIVKNYHQVNYNYVGFIKMDTNERYDYRTRESRKVYINSKSLFLKIQMDKNYINQYNMFNQVGLMYIDFMGEYLPYLGGKNRSNNLILENALRRDNNTIKDEDLTNICGDKLDKLKELMDKNIKTENYEECKHLKLKIEKIRNYGRKIYELESQKKIAVNNEDFDKAMELRDLVDKLKNNLKMIDENQIANNKFNTADLLDIDNQIIGNNNLNNISLVPNLNNNTINDSGIINESINENLMSQFEQSNNNNNNNNNNNINKSLFNNNNILSNINNSNSNKNNTRENFLNHDDMVLPAVLKRMSNEPESKQDEFGEADKGELEPLSSQKLLKDFYIIANVIKEEGMRKVFSKQILWKEEGLSILSQNLSKILEYKEDNNPKIINVIITQIMKLCMIVIEDKHPSIIIKTLELLKQLFEYIKQHNIKLNIDSGITDSVLFKIKQKLGDVNPKVRAKAVSLYCYMLTLNFCDYDNLISELLEEELKHYDSKYIPKSSNLISGKLDIFISVFNNFSDAIKSKRTKVETFPSNLVIDYLIMNVSHNKSEIRKKTRLVIGQFIRIFGVPKFKKKIEKIEERELMKLVAEIPELREFFPKLYSPSTADLSDGGIETNSSNNKGRQNSKSNLKINNLYNFADNNDKKNSSKNNNNNNNNVKKKSINANEDNSNSDQNNNNNNNNLEDKKNNDNSKIKQDNKSSKNKSIKKHTGFCEYCQRKMKDGEVLANHWITNCKMFIQCEKCNMNLEVQKLNDHKEKECNFKNQFKLCKTCHECFLKEDFSKHQKEKCSLKKGSKKCPLCHKDIDISNKNAFFIHLVKQGCPQQVRK